MKKESKFVINHSSLFGGCEVSNMHGFTSITNGGYPSFIPFVKTYAFIAAFIVSSFSFIFSVPRSSTLAKIRTTIIKRVSIYVIALLACVWFKNLAMHLYATYWKISDCIKTSGYFAPICIPIPLRQPHKILSINNSVLTLRKWDKADRLVKWLDNFVSNYTIFCHFPTSSRNLIPATSIAQRGG